MPSLYIISLVCQVVVVLSIHPSRHPSIQVPHPRRRRWKRRRRRKNSYSLAICQNLQTNFLKLKMVEKKMRNKRRNLFKTTQEISN
jgi:hypothetical protein